MEFKPQPENLVAIAVLETDSDTQQSKSPTPPGACAPPAARSGPELHAETLWTVADAATFLRKSQRWLFGQLKIDDTQPGSIPHVRLGRSPRFIPDDLKAWAAAGFPPAATFKEWKEMSARRKRNLN
mgnify:CR=1 FL=1